MQNNMAFIPPAMMTKYSNGEYRFVGYSLKIGDEVYIEQDRSGKPQKRTVDKIVEERPSNGEWQTSRPTSYRIAVI